MDPVRALDKLHMFKFRRWLFVVTNYSHAVDSGFLADERGQSGPFLEREDVARISAVERIAQALVPLHYSRLLFLYCLSLPFVIPPVIVRLNEIGNLVENPLKHPPTHRSHDITSITASMTPPSIR